MLHQSPALQHGLQQLPDSQASGLNTCDAKLVSGELPRSDQAPPALISVVVELQSIEMDLYTYVCSVFPTEPVWADAADQIGCVLRCCGGSCGLALPKSDII